MKDTFVRWVKADNAINTLRKQIAEIEREIKIHEAEIEDARSCIAQEMQNDGVVSNTINGEFIDYEIYFTAGRESVKIENSDAVPDEFCKIERKPKLREIKEYIDAGNQVNWACIQRGEGKLTYKAKVRK